MNGKEDWHKRDEHKFKGDKQVGRKRSRDVPLFWKKR